VVKLWLAGKLKAGTESAVAWKAVEKKELLANKDVTLNAERYMGGADVEHEHEVVTIGEICVDVQSGYSCSANKQTATGVPHLRSQNITDQGQLTLDGAKFVPEEIAAANESYALRKGDILFNNTNSVELVGKTCLYDSNERAHYSNHTTRLRVDEARALPRFVALALHQLFKRGEFAKLCTRWVGQAGVSTTLLKQVEIPLPPLEEQRRIVAEIAGYQQVLDGARQILAGYQPRVDAQPDWPVAPLSDAAELTGGYAFKSTEMKPAAASSSDFPVVKIGNVGRDGRLDMTDAEFHTFTPDLARFVLHPGDIAVAMTGATVGKVAEVDRDNLLLNQRVGVVRRKETAEQKFLLHVLRGPDFYNYCQATAGGGAQGNISPRQILEYEIPLPSLAEQRRLVAELDAEAAQMEAVRALLPASRPKSSASSTACGARTREESYFSLKPSTGLNNGLAASSYLGRKGPMSRSLPSICAARCHPGFESPLDAVGKRADLRGSIPARLRFSGFPRKHAQMWRVSLFFPRHELREAGA
jgi:restriction endonuclease S subunit